MPRFNLPRPSTLLPVILATLLVACSSSPPKPKVDYKTDYNFDQIKTIAFMQHVDRASGDGSQPFISDMVINRVDLALERSLQNKGFTVVDKPEQADALINWHLVTQEKTDIRTYNTGPAMGGYYGSYRGYNRSAFYNCWNCGTDVQVRQYTQGTFIVDIIDTKLKQSVFRSIIQSRLKGDFSRDQADYDTAANNILAAFPPY